MPSDSQGLLFFEESERQEPVNNKTKNPTYPSGYAEMSSRGDSVGRRNSHVKALKSQGLQNAPV
jgi:hypothetical protein